MYNQLSNSKSIAKNVLNALHINSIDKNSHAKIIK